MSGHNKWSGIKHRKEAQDAKRSKIFSRIAKAIMVAVQNGDTDPETNSALKLAMDQARKANMPKDNVERALKRGSNSDEARIEEVTYEGMGPGGSAMMILCATDNTNRALTDVKTALKKNGGKFVPSGSVSFQFEYVGHITTTPADKDAAELQAIEAGAEDLVWDGDTLTIMTRAQDLHAVLKTIDQETVNDAKLIYHPTQTVTLSESDRATFDALYSAVEDVDDVVAIFDNVA